MGSGGLPTAMAARWSSGGGFGEGDVVRKEVGLNRRPLSSWPLLGGLKLIVHGWMKSNVLFGLGLGKNYLAFCL
jgi:hypothetical protein